MGFKASPRSVNHGVTITFTMRMIQFNSLYQQLSLEKVMFVNLTTDGAVLRGRSGGGGSGVMAVWSGDLSFG